MNDRFALAFMLSLGMHALLLGLVAALGLPQAGRVESSARTVIPVSLFAIDAAPTALMPGEATGGQQPLAQQRPAAPTPPAPTRPVIPAGKEQAAPPKAVEPARGLPQPAEMSEADEPALHPANAAEIRDARQEPSPDADLATAKEGLPHAGVDPLGNAAGQGAAPVAGAATAEPGFSGGSGGEEQGGGSRKGEAGDVLIPAEFLAGNSPPRYPLLARRKGWEGTVVIEIRVSGSGRIQQAHVEKSSGYAILDGAALGAIRSWRIALNGRLDEADMRLRIPVIFKLREA